jgi:ATP-binding cassette subfamily B protein
MYTGPAVMYFVNLAAVIGFSVFFMLRSDVKLTLVALSPLPILAFTIYFVNNIINQKSEQIQSLLSDLTSNAQESYSGIRVIKSFVQEKAMLHYFKKNSEQYRSHALNLAKTESIYFPSMGLLIGLSTLITIMVGSIDVVYQVPGASVGKIAEFVMYIQLLTFPVSAIGWTASMTQRAIASQRRINEFLQTQPTVQDKEPPLKPSSLDNIVLDQIDFTYSHTGIHAIQNISLTIQKGEKVAIVGKTGSGKSTLAQLLLKMHPLQKGKLTFNHQPQEQIPASWIRKKISYVPQDVFLFSDTIENNIRFGNKDASEASIIQSAKNACVYHEIMSFPEGFQTMIGERGVMLSGGQKQRISIARALLKEAEIIILDDCLSAVDNKTSQAILHHLTEYLKDKTAILITHRITNLFNFDQIIVLNDGKLAENGSHTALMDQKGLYFDMYTQQIQESLETSQQG